MKTSRVFALLCLLVLPALAVAEEKPAKPTATATAEPKRADELTVLGLKVLEAERQARAEYFARLRTEARALQLELPQAQKHLADKEQELRAALAAAATKAGVDVKEHEIDLATGVWRKRGGVR